MSVVRVISFAAAALLTACATDGSEKTYYGYEDEYVLPEPDMVPDAPDDKPGRTVDEMVRDGVTVNRVRATADDGAVYERAGRFGSKEKIALRRGLNAPSADDNRNDRTRAPETNVRPLDVQGTIARDDLVFKSEQEMLEAVIKPRQSKVTPIEVVGLDLDKKPAAESKGTPSGTGEGEAGASAPADDGTSAAELLKKAADEAEAKAAAKASEDQLLVAAAAPAPDDDAPVLRGTAEELGDAPVLLEPPVEEEEEEAIVLREPPEEDEFDDEEEEEVIALREPPEEEEEDFVLEEPEAPIVLKMPPEETDEEVAVRMPSAKKSASSNRQSLGLIRFSKNSALLPLTAGETVKDAARLYEFNPEGRVLVVGYDAPNGSKSLAIKRAAATSSALVAAGVPANRISRRAETKTPDGEIVGSHAQIFLVKGGVIK